MKIKRIVKERLDPAARVNKRRASLLAATILMAVAVSAAGAKHFSPWGTATKIDEIPGWSSELNTPFLDGCPIQSPDGLSLYMASNRPADSVSSTSGSRGGRAGMAPSAPPRTWESRSTRPPTTSARPRSGEEGSSS